jgi:uncharacterized protein YukE
MPGDAASAPSAAEWDVLHQRLTAVPAQANEAITAIFDMVNGVLAQRWCPPWLTSWIKPVLDALVASAARMLKTLSEYLIGFDFPLIAFAVANDWNEVKNPVNAVNADVSEPNLHVGDYWQGTAAVAYTNAVTAQTAAMTEVAAIVGELQLRLWVVAGAMVAFYVSVGAILVQWISVMIAASTADATGIGAVLGIPVQVGDTAIAAEALVAAGAALLVVIAAEAQSYTTLDGRIASSAKFPGGHWPRAVADVLSDGSENDGNDTKWHLKQ